MNIKKQGLHLSIALGGLFVSGTALSHSAYELNPVNGTREFSENTTHYLKLSLNHTCTNPAGESTDILHAGVLLPNANALITEYDMNDAGSYDTTAAGTDLTDLTSVLATSDNTGIAFGANALMSIKPVLDANWGRIEAFKDTVPEFYSHGAVTKDVRTIRYLNVRNPYDSNAIGLPNDFTTSLQFKANVGKLQGCVAKVRVFTPSADYCAGGIVKIWTNAHTELLTEALITDAAGHLDISTGYAPAFDIVRAANNPLAESCGNGKIVTLYPSSADIDTHLGQWAPEWAGVMHDHMDETTDIDALQCAEDQHFHSTSDTDETGVCVDNHDTETVTQCPEGQHLMPDTGMCMDNDMM